MTKLDVHRQNKSGNAKDKKVRSDTPEEYASPSPHVAHVVNSSSQICWIGIKPNVKPSI